MLRFVREYPVVSIVVFLFVVLPVTIAVYLWVYRRRRLRAAIEKTTKRLGAERSPRTWLTNVILRFECHGRKAMLLIDRFNLSGFLGFYNRRGTSADSRCSEMVIELPGVAGQLVVVRHYGWLAAMEVAANLITLDIPGGLAERTAGSGDPVFDARWRMASSPESFLSNLLESERGKRFTELISKLDDFKNVRVILSREQLMVRVEGDLGVDDRLDVFVDASIALAEVING